MNIIHRFNKYFYYFTFLFFYIFLSGCATPQAVKSLSNEQVEIQKAFNKALTEYLTIIEKFTISQKNNAIKRINQRLDEQISLQEDLNSIDFLNISDDKKIKNQLSSHGKKILQLNKSEQKNIKLIEERVYKLIEHHKKLLKTQSNLIQAQTKLNEYIQIEKADEVAFANLTGKVQKTKSEIQNIIDDINSTLSLF